MELRTDVKPKTSELFLGGLLRRGWGSCSIKQSRRSTNRITWDSNRSMVEDEIFPLNYTGPGVLSKDNDEFFISTRYDRIDKRNRVDFGRVVEGIDVVKKIYYDNSNPSKRFTIAKCGQC